MTGFTFGMVVGLWFSLFFIGVSTAHDNKQDDRIEALQTQVAQLEAR